MEIINSIYSNTRRCAGASLHKALQHADEFRNSHALYNLNERKLLSLHNKYSQNSCFVLGNGPSLNADDLNQLYEKGIVCFGSNKIFKIFHSTQWRPAYYACTDRNVFQHNFNAILTEIECPLFLNKTFKRIPDTSLRAYENIRSIYYLNYYGNNSEIPFYKYPGIFYSGGSVTFVMIQLAWLMGFRSIYLLGCDNTYYQDERLNPGSVLTSLDVENGYFSKDYLDASETMILGDFNKCLKGYNSAKNYANLHGGNIFNATRGGKLEVFQRVDFSQIIKEFKPS